LTLKEIDAAHVGERLLHAVHERRPDAALELVEL